MTISAADFHITNSTVQDIENLNLALFYLQGSSVATDILKNMVRLGVTISITDHINDSFDLGVNIIYWNPKSSLVILDSTGRAVGVDSAAIALIHQGAQATDPHFIENASHPNSQYGNDAEQYAFGKANQVCIDLGETQRVNLMSPLCMDTNPTNHTVNNNGITNGILGWQEQLLAGDVTVTSGSYKLGTQPIQGGNLAVVQDAHAINVNQASVTIAHGAQVTVNGYNNVFTMENGSGLRINSLKNNTVTGTQGVLVIRGSNSITCTNENLFVTSTLPLADIIIAGSGITIMVNHATISLEDNARCIIIGENNTLTTKKTKSTNFSGTAEISFGTEGQLLISQTVNTSTYALSWSIITAYTNHRTSSVPVLSDYGFAGISGVTAKNLAGINFVVHGKDVNDFPNRTAVQTAVNNFTPSWLKFISYSNQGTTSAPDLADYANIGISGITTTNIDRINVLLRNKNLSAAQDPSPIKKIADDFISSWATITTYINRGTTPEPVASDYTNVGIFSFWLPVTALNFMVRTVKMANLNDPATLQTVIVNFLKSWRQFTSYVSNNNSVAPVVLDYTNIGVSGVTQTNLDAVNNLIHTQILTTLQDASLIKNRVNNFIPSWTMITTYVNTGTASAPTVSDYINIGISDVTQAMINLINDRLHTPDPEFIISTPQVIQRLVDTVQFQINAALNRMVAYALGISATPLTLMDYYMSGVSGVRQDTLNAINKTIQNLSNTSVLNQALFQAQVNQINANNPAPITGPSLYSVNSKSSSISFENANGGVFVSLNPANPWVQNNVAIPGNLQNIVGSDYNDTLFGSDKNDLLSGGSGSNIIDGKGGINTISYANLQFAVKVNLDQRIATGTPTDWTSVNSTDPRKFVQDTIFNIQNVTGTDYNDTILGSKQNNLLNGGFGHDVFEIKNTSGQDTLISYSGMEEIIFSDSPLSAYNADSYKQFVFKASNNHLWIEHLGTMDKVLVQNFFSLGTSAVVKIKTSNVGDGTYEKITASDIKKLVEAMSGLVVTSAQSQLTSSQITEINTALSLPSTGPTTLSSLWSA